MQKPIKITMQKKPEKPKKKRKYKIKRGLFVCKTCGMPTLERCNDPMTCDNAQFKVGFNPNY